MEIIKTLLLAGILLLCSCKSKKSSSDSGAESGSGQNETRVLSSESESESRYEDGEYCATVEYYNPNTGTQSSYELTVEVENGELTQINWPNGGWLDSSHFTPEELDADGSVTFTSDRSYEYTVAIESEGPCVRSYHSSDDESEIEDEEEQEDEEDNEVEVTVEYR
jgi:hypothetical protein